MNDFGFEQSLQKMRELLASWPRRGGGERVVSSSWLESQIRVHRQISELRVPGGTQDIQVLAESEFILEGLKKNELRERSRYGQGSLWEIINLKVVG
jgi:hypothetical protein